MSVWPEQNQDIRPCSAEGTAALGNPGEAARASKYEQSCREGGFHWAGAAARQELREAALCFCLGNEMSHQKLHAVIYHQQEISSWTGGVEIIPPSNSSLSGLTPGLGKPLEIGDSDWYKL